MLSMTLDWLTGWVKLETHFISLSHKEIEESLYDCLFFPCAGDQVATSKCSSRTGHLRLTPRAN